MVKLSWRLNNFTASSIYSESDPRSEIRKPRPQNWNGFVLWTLECRKISFPVQPWQLACIKICPGICLSISPFKAVYTSPKIRKIIWKWENCKEGIEVMIAQWFDYSKAKLKFNLLTVMGVREWMKSGWFSAPREPQSIITCTRQSRISLLYPSLHFQRKSLPAAVVVTLAWFWRLVILTAAQAPCGTPNLSTELEASQVSSPWDKSTLRKFKALEEAWDKHGIM